MKFNGEIYLRGVCAVVAIGAALCFSLWAEEHRPEALRIADPIRQGGIVVFPVVSTVTVVSDYQYTTLDEGLASGQVVISEIGGSSQQLQTNVARETAQATQQTVEQEQSVQQHSSGAQVNTLVISNNSERYLYLMTGEVIKGAKQDRMIARDVVLPPGVQDVALDVFCVESGRWAFESERFASAQVVTGAQIRSTAQVAKDQNAVWAQVAQVNRAVGASSATGTLRAAYEKEDVRAQIEEHGQLLGAQLDSIPGVVGVVVAINGQIVVADIFGLPQLFLKLRHKLLASYILDALTTQDGGGGVPALEDVRRYLDRILIAERRLDVRDEHVKVYYIQTDEAQGTRTFHGSQELHLNSFPETP